MKDKYIDTCYRYLTSLPILYNKMDKPFGREFKYVVEEITSHKN
uniref:Uncharacterized protein n=1 Tax=Nitrosopumivirus cobalaminus TaxID=3158414 RepID=A0AAU7N442_9VIRU